MNDLHELEAAEARRRAEYEQRHAELVRDASRTLGKARLSKSAGTSPVLAPVGHPDTGIMFMPEGTQFTPVHGHPFDSSGPLCIRESGGTGVLLPSCHHDECHKSYRKALKASRRFSGPSLPPVPSLSLEMAATSTSTVSNLPITYQSNTARSHPQYHFHARPGSPSHTHSYSPYPRVSPPIIEKERDSYMVIEGSSPVGGSSSSLTDSMFSTLAHGILGQAGISNERSTSGPASQAQFTPSASPFLRPLQSLGLDSPSVSPKMGQSALGMVVPSDAHVGEMGFLDAAGIRTNEPVFGKRRDSSTTVTYHDFSRSHLRTVLPQVKSESTPTSPTWRYVRKPVDGSSASPPPTVDHGTPSTSSSPPSPALYSHSLPHTPHHMRGQPPHHHHLAHSVRMAFAMTPIQQLDSGSPPHTVSPHAHSHASSPSTIPPSTTSSSSNIHATLYKPLMPGTNASFSHSPSRTGSPPIVLPPLSASTPNSTATASSRAPSPTGYITLPPLKTHTAAGSVKSRALVSTDEALMGMSGDGAGGILANGDAISSSSGAPGERITLPGFSELMRAADS